MVFGKMAIPNHVSVSFVVRMESIQEEKSCHGCEPGECDAFEFMAKNLGLRVLHPGGLEATEMLAESCDISRDMTILDAGCGRGSSSIFLARRYGCKVVGVDIDPILLASAHANARKNGVLDRVAFRFADINALPFEDQIFDGVIFQAALIFVDKFKALQMTHRKIRPEGFVGAVELAWKSLPPYSIADRVRKVICSAAVNTEHHLNWIDLFRQTGFSIVHAQLRDLEFSFRGMLKNEGLLHTLRIALRCAIDKSAKRRTEEFTNLFRETREYLGYGIYVGRKPKIDRGITQHQDPRALGHTSDRKIQY